MSATSLAPASSQGALKIARLDVACELNGPRELLADVETRVSWAMQSHLADSLRASFASWFDRDDDSRWVVRRLELELLVGADVPADVLASAISARLGHELGMSLRGDGDGVNAIRFRSRAEQLACLVRDLERGEAWSRWYHAPFAGLRLLPISAAIRSALGARPLTGLQALLLLTEAELERVCRALSAGDETLLLMAFSSLPSVPPSAGVESPLRSSWVDLSAPRGGQSAPLDSDAASLGWLGYRRAVRRGLQAGRQLFAVVAAASYGGAPDQVVDSVERIQRAFARWEQLGPAALAKLAPFVRGAAAPPSFLRHEDDALSPELLRAMLAELSAAASATAKASSDAAEPESLRTRFGGLLLLLRDLDALPWDTWTSDWPPCDGGTLAAPTLRWLTLAACAGRDQMAPALADSALRQLFGIAPTCSLPDVITWLRLVGAARRARLEIVSDDTSPPSSPIAMPPRHRLGLPRDFHRRLDTLATRVLAAFAQRLPGFSESSPDHLRKNFLSFDATVDYEPERVVVRCGRPPLQLILTLTGMTRGTTAGHDARGRAIVLFSE